VVKIENECRTLHHTQASVLLMYIPMNKSIEQPGFRHPLEENKKVCTTRSGPWGSSNARLSTDNRFYPHIGGAIYFNPRGLVFGVLLAGFQPNSNGGTVAQFVCSEVRRQPRIRVASDHLNSNVSWSWESMPVDVLSSYPEFQNPRLPIKMHSSQTKS
jgi:hypothetical protein